LASTNAEGNLMTAAEQIRSMTNAELTAAARVVGRQVAAPFLVGDRDERKSVLTAINAEITARGGQRREISRMQRQR
jgi:hypothetical protein